LLPRNYSTHPEDFAVATATKISCFREITAPTQKILQLQLPLKFLVSEKLPYSPRSFYTCNCHKKFMFPRNYRTHPEDFAVATATKISCFREITAPAQKFLHLQLPLKFLVSEKLPHQLTSFPTYNCHFYILLKNLWQS